MSICAARARTRSPTGCRDRGILSIAGQAPAPGLFSSPPALRFDLFKLRV